MTRLENRGTRKNLRMDVRRHGDSEPVRGGLFFVDSASSASLQAPPLGRARLAPGVMPQA